MKSKLRKALALLRKEQPTPGKVHHDAPLTNLSVLIVQDETRFVATRWAAKVPVQQKSNTFYTWPTDAWQTDEATEIGEDGETPGSGMEPTEDTYRCKLYGFHKETSDSTIDNSDPAIDPRRAATRFVMTKVLIRLDRIWADTFFKTGVWGTDTNITATSTKWDDPLSSPIKDVITAKRAVQAKTGLIPQKIVLGASVFDALQTNPQIEKRFRGSTNLNAPIDVTPAMLAEIFGVKEVLVADAIYDAAAEKAATRAKGFISNSKAVLITYMADAPGLDIPSAAYNFVWTGRRGVSPEGTRIDIIDMNVIGRETEKVKGTIAIDMRIVAKDLGAFLYNVVT